MKVSGAVAVLLLGAATTAAACGGGAKHDAASRPKYVEKIQPGFAEMLVSADDLPPGFKPGENHFEADGRLGTMDPGFCDAYFKTESGYVPAHDAAAGFSSGDGATEIDIYEDLARFDSVASAQAVVAGYRSAIASCRTIRADRTTARLVAQSPSNRDTFAWRVTGVDSSASPPKRFISEVVVTRKGKFVVYVSVDRGLPKTDAVVDVHSIAALALRQVQV